MSFYRTFKDNKDTSMSADLKENAKIHKTSKSVSCRFLHKDLVDSFNVAATFLHSWIKINVLLGLLNFFKEAPFVKIAQLRHKDKSFNNEKDKTQKPNHGFYHLRKICLARAICLSNQETTWLKNPVANIVAEALR